MCEWVLGGLLGGLVECASWAALYNTWLLIKLTPKDVVFSFLFWNALALVCAILFSKSDANMFAFPL